MTKDDHRRAFAAFAGAVLADFDRYLARDDADPPREGVLYRQGAVYVTEDEFAELVDELEAVVARRTRTEPGDGRVRHIIGLVLVPDKTGGTGDGT
ncbi:hypothetical protein [Actinomadura physcomitrii]|uniref:hypothetical protein n=1 Tax=Actinomadura physcomitrii TaxID=2650748 RepID=UPI001924E6E2|nr:hypothetical protein [Actinomadura physcomitrii]